MGDWLLEHIKMLISSTVYRLFFMLIFHNIRVRLNFLNVCVSDIMLYYKTMNCLFCDSEWTMHMDLSIQ